MTKQQRVRQLTWLFIAGIWIGAGIEVLRPQPTPSTVALPLGAAPAEAIVLESAMLASSATEILSRDAFRLDRAPSRARFLPWPVSEQSPVEQMPQRTVPSLVLVGVLSGSPLQVVVEGIPGFERGVLFKTGEEIAGIRFLRISGDTVVLAGFDTSWVFTQARVR